MHGLTALTFDSTTVTWRCLLNPDQLSGIQRYATVVGTLPAMPPSILQPSIFTQDTQGKVQWARIVESPNVTSPIEQKTTISPRMPGKGLSSTNN